MTIDLDALIRRFTSSNSVPVERAYLTKAEFDGLIQRLREAEKDKARLDWSEKQCFVPEHGCCLRDAIDSEIIQRRIASGEDLGL